MTKTKKSAAAFDSRSANKRSDYVVLAVGVICSLGLIIGGLVGGMGALLYSEDALQEDPNVSEQTLGMLGDFILYGALAAVLLVFTLVMIRMMRQQMLGNALQVEYSDYAWLREWSNKVAADLDMPRVEIMVTQDPVINAYAFGFAKPYTIVLHSGSVRWLTHEQLKVVVLHEMGHVKFHHTKISTYLSPLMMLPIVGSVNNWMLGFWSRRAELTADRLALHYMRNEELVKASLIGVHVGPDVASSFNDVARQWQAYTTRNTFNRFTQTFSDHPFLVRRLQRLTETSALLGLSSQQQSVESEVAHL